MAQRSRNSVSSCGAYPVPATNISRRHSSSVASLDYQSQPQARQPKPKAQNNKQNQPASLLAYPEIEARYLRPLYDNLHAIKSTNSPEPITVQLLAEWHRLIKAGICKLRDLYKHVSETSNKIQKDKQGKKLQQKQSEDLLEKIKAKFEQQNKQLKQTLQKFKAEYQDQARQRETQFSNKFLQLSTQFGKREQNYREVISKCIHAMNNAQRKSRHEMHQRQAKNIHSKQATLKLKKTVDTLKKYLMVEERNKGVYEAITKFIDELYDCDEGEAIQSQPVIEQMERERQRLKVNQGITNLESGKFNEQNSFLNEDQSLESLRALQARQSHTIDMSSIAVDESEQFGEQSLNIDQNQLEIKANILGKSEDEICMNFDQCLSRMVCWNFFGAANHSTITRLMKILKDAQNPELFIQEPIYPIILQACKLAIGDQQDAEKEPYERDYPLRANYVQEFGGQCVEQSLPQNSATYKQESLQRLSGGLNGKSLQEKSMDKILNKHRSQIPKSYTFKI